MNLQKIPFFYRVLFGVVVLLINLDIQAQVASPPLTANTAADSPAVSGFRAFKTIGGYLNNRVIKGNGYETKLTEATYLLATHIIGPFYNETIATTAVRSTKYDIGTSRSKTIQSGKTNFAWKALEFISIGVCFIENKIKLIEETTVNGTVVDDYKSITDQSALGIGSSMRIFDFIYIGGGYEEFSEESSSKVNNAWKNQFLGAGMIWQYSKDSGFRVEGSQISSSKSYKPASGDGLKFKNDHNGYIQNKGEAEWKPFESFLLRWVILSDTQFLGGGIKLQEVSNQFGLIGTTSTTFYDVPGIIMWGGFYTQGTLTMKDETGTSKQGNTQDLKFSLSFNW